MKDAKKTKAKKQRLGFDAGRWKSKGKGKDGMLKGKV